MTSSTVTRRCLQLCITLGCGSLLLLASERTRLKKVSSVIVPWTSYGVLQDANEDGLLLLGGISEEKTDPGPRLALWSTKKQKSEGEIRLEAQPRQFLGPFKFVREGRFVVGLNSPWVILVNLQKRAIVRRTLITPDLLGRDHSSPTQTGNLSLTPLMAVDPKGEAVAIAVNLVKEPRLFVFAPDLTHLLMTRRLARYVAGLSWSPDGTRLAVLYSGSFDQDYEFRGMEVHSTILHLPDVEILDPRSDSTLLKFATGAPEAKIAFSDDGRLLYCISQSKWGGYIRIFGDWGKDVLRIFSASNGRLQGVIKGGASGIRNNFAVSSRDNLVAADASTEAHNFNILAEGPFGVKIGRCVVIDLKSGRRIFERHRRMPGSYEEPMRLLFSADGRSLYVDPNYFGWSGGQLINVWIEKSGSVIRPGRHVPVNPERVDVYSVDVE